MFMFLLNSLPHNNKVFLQGNEFVTLPANQSSVSSVEGLPGPPRGGWWINSDLSAILDAVTSTTHHGGTWRPLQDSVSGSKN